MKKLVTASKCSNDMKKLLTTFLLSAAVALCACDDPFDRSDSIDFGAFKMKVAPGWGRYTAQGYDSNTGGITKRQDTLKYDYGWFAGDFPDISSSTHTIVQKTIDGRQATIIYPKKKGKGIIGIHILADTLNRLSMYGITDEESATLEMFESIRFE